MLVTLSGIVTLVKALQPENAESPMLVTLSGIVTLVKPLQPENAEFAMRVTQLGIVTSPFTPFKSVSPSFDNNSPFTDEYFALFSETYGHRGAHLKRQTYRGHHRACRQKRLLVDYFFCCHGFSRSPIVLPCMHIIP